MRTKDVFIKLFGLQVGMRVKIHSPGSKTDKKKGIIVSRINNHFYYVKFDNPIHIVLDFGSETTIYMSYFPIEHLEVIE